MAKEVLDTIMNIQPKDSGGGGGETRETVVFRQAEDMLQKLPPDYLPHEVAHSHMPTHIICCKKFSLAINKYFYEN